MRTFREIAVAYLNAYQAKDLAAIADLIAPNVELRDWNLGGAGVEFFLSETKKNFENANDISIEILGITESDFSVACELKILLDGASIELRLVDVLSFDSEGRISAVRAYKG